MTSRVQGERAIPLCLPGNYQWDPETMKCTKTGEERSYMYVVEEALKKLRRIKGPVCVVSITGPYRKGKSYILSEAFHQPDVFPLGHTMLAETVGIWMWILPEKLKDCNGQEVSVVLLDTEGTESAQGTGFDDHQIFTLTVLVSSVLIYNSSAVANRRDLEELEFIVNLSQRIQVRSRSECDVGPEDSDIFHETFPYFVWLLRDVTLSLPSDCSNVKDYFLTKVFQEVATSEKSKEATHSILKFFSGFDAFALPLPTDKMEVLHNISNSKDTLSAHFLKDLRQFQLFMKDVIVAKKSVKTEEPVTGE
ncbi:guanylate-binding protein 2-like, partial [Pocillopora damicornis]|uniref:guanylate-binding protein 2-like n=1 Tax=Pocillopora damicornis TaxID=46731 RepID=UPI000F555192